MTSAQPPTVLIVEDNPITRKLVRVTLEAAGYGVLEAQDGRTAIELMGRHLPDLVLQDLILPDLDGFELVKRLRALARGAEVPILAFSGFVGKSEQDWILQQGFSDFLCKPVEPSQLVHAVGAYLPMAEPGQEQPGHGHRILVAHDDPIQLKLLRIHLEQVGFRVTTAGDGAEALEQARRSPPDAIVSDVLMPRLDGFRLCQAVRADQELAHVPVILVSAAYTEEEDQRLAQAVGASAFVLLTPDLRHVVESLLANLREATPRPALPAEALGEQYTHRVVHQLERQADLNVELARRLTSLESELGILAGLAQAVVGTSSIETVLNWLLQRCTAGAGVSRGAAYLVEGDGQLALRAQLGYPEGDERPLQELFGHPDLLQRVIAAGEPMALSSEQAGADQVGDLLLRAKARSMLIAPLVLGAERLGALVMASEDRDLGEEWVAFIKVVGIQVGQAIGLARAHAQLRASEERLAFLAEASSVLAETLDYETTLTNLAHLAVPFLADWCLVNVVMADGSLRPLAAAHVDPARVEWVRRLQRDYSPDPNASDAILEAVLSGRSVFLPDVPESLLVAYARDVQHPEIIRQLGARSAIAVPLVARGRTLAAMVLVLAESGRRYTRADLVLAEDLARRAALAIDNARLYGEAQAAVRARDDFLSVAAHELKTPVTALRGFAQLAVRQVDGQGSVDPARVQQALHVIDQQSAKLARLVAHLLDRSRIEAGKLELDRQVTDLTSLVEGVVAAAQLSISRHTLVVQAPPSLPSLVDPLRLEQVVANLVDNAVKFSPAGGQIDIELSTPDAGTVRLAVRDRGLGIPPEHRAHVFDRYYQAHARGHAGGMGLGLYISRQIVHLHGGELAAEFPPDGGTRFVVTLPIPPSAVPASVQEPAAA
ncbi:MAG: response regulator [Chloroflexi bacterium]|nr:response regulator [Chloroflexota bacterium]